MINRYFVICLISLCFGIAFYVYGNTLLLLAEIVVLFLFFILKRRNVFLIAIICVLVGGIHSSAKLNMEKMVLYTYADNMHKSGTFQILDIIQTSSNYIFTEAKILSIEGDDCNEKVTLTIYAPFDIKINGIYDFQKMKIKLNEKDDIIAYGSDKVFFKANVTSENLVFQGVNNKGFINSLRALRESANNYINSKFNSDTGALLCALYTGETSYISTYHKNIFTETGINHILSVSGMHVVIIMTVCGYIFDRLGKFKYLKYLILFIFTVFTGATPAIIRASAIFVFLGISQIVKRTPDSVNILALIALVSLLFNPLLLFDKSFQLSYMATYGVIAVSPIFYTPLASKTLDFITKTTAATISAQLMTLPVILTFTTQISVMSITANIVASLIIYLLYSTSFLSMVIPFDFLSKACEFITKIFYNIVSFLSTDNILDIKFSHIDTAIILASVVTAIFFIVSVDRKSRMIRKEIKKMD